jgi:hypothetical protein
MNSTWEQRGNDWWYCDFTKLADTRGWRNGALPTCLQAEEDLHRPPADLPLICWR